jgi:transposase
MGLKSGVARNTLANANQTRDWRIFADFALALINIARPLYLNEDFGVELDNTVYALDSSTIDLCLSSFPWAHFRKNKGAIKLHTLLDLRGPIPTFIYISDGKLHDVNVLDILEPEPGAYYIMDRGYIDYERLYRIHQTPAFFVIKAKDNMSFERIYSQPANKDAGLICDQIIRLTGHQSSENYPERLRRIHSYDQETQTDAVLLTNNFLLPATTIAALYKCRWQVELFFKWIKQHLRIKAFFGTSENAVKSQVWIAISVYVLVAIIKKRMSLNLSLYTILQILSLSLFEKMPILQALAGDEPLMSKSETPNQLNLFS